MENTTRTGFREHVIRLKGYKKNTLSEPNYSVDRVGKLAAWASLNCAARLARCSISSATSTISSLYTNHLIIFNDCSIYFKSNWQMHMHITESTKSRCWFQKLSHISLANSLEKRRIDRYRRNRNRAPLKIAAKRSVGRSEYDVAMVQLPRIFRGKEVKWLSVIMTTNKIKTLQNGIKWIK